MGFALLKEPVPIETDPDGTARIAGTRVTLDSVVIAFNMGATAEEIASQYPALALPDVYAVITYYLRQQGEVDAYLLERRKISRRVRRQNESRFHMTSIRTRLLARKENAGKMGDA